MNCFKKVTLRAGLLLTVAAGIFGSCSGSKTEQPQIERAVVFAPGDFDSKFYRIPAIVTAANGDLVAVADKRIESNGDLPGRIDVVCRRSTDGGRTWSDYITVAANDEGGGYGDPALVVDRNTGDIICISTHGNGLWQDAPGHSMISRSRDNGLTWEPPVDIAEMICVGEDAPLKNVAGAFASSGGALQLSSGRLMYVLVVREKDVDNFSCYAVYSDDGGVTWNVSKNPGTYNGDESKVVELADGSVLMSIRSRRGGNRAFSLSTDGGETWGEPWEAEDIKDPRCNGDILRYTADGRDVLLQSLPGSPNSREDVTIYVSEDNAKTWPVSFKVTDLSSAYSAMTVLPDGSVGILTEEEDPNNENKYQYYLVFTRIPFDMILNGYPEGAAPADSVPVRK